jgi:hypothetical protein
MQTKGKIRGKNMGLKAGNKRNKGNRTVSISQLRRDYGSLCGKLGRISVLHAVPRHDGGPHVEIIGDKYHYVVTERGSELERKITTDRQELLYWLISGVVFEMAGDFELKHRVKGQDFRRLKFAKEIKLMGKISSEWGERMTDDIEKILAVAPYDDRLGG